MCDFFLKKWVAAATLENITYKDKIIKLKNMAVF